MPEKVEHPASKIMRGAAKSPNNNNNNNNNATEQKFGLRSETDPFTGEVSDSSASHASPTLVEPGTLTVHH